MQSTPAVGAKPLHSFHFAHLMNPTVVQKIQKEDGGELQEVLGPPSDAPAPAVCFEDSFKR
jgi:hypothetical protein